MPLPLPSTPPPPLPLPAGPLPGAGWMLRELLRQRTAACPGREALKFSDRVLSHRELLERVDDWGQRVETAARSSGAADPQRLWAIHGGDTVDNLLLGLSQLFAGRPLLLLPLHAPPAERASLVHRGGVGAVLTDRPLPEPLGFRCARALGDGWELWLPADGPAGGEAPGAARPSALLAAAGAADPPAHDRPDSVPAALAAILRRPLGVSLSSGTTSGRPALQLSSGFEALGMLQQPEWPLSRRMLFGFRLQFGASRAWAERILLEGGTLCCVRVEQRLQLPELAGALGADTLAVNPPYLEQMLAEGLEARFPADLAFVTGTDRVPADLRRRFQDRFGQRLTIALANSRLGPLTQLPPERLLDHDGEAVGLPLANVRFRFEPAAVPGWQALGIGEAVVAKTWRVRLQHPAHGLIDLEHTVEESRPGDLLRRWPDGVLSFAGRADEVFLFRSQLISPLEIEEILARDAAVLEVLAFGAPSSVYGAVPMAAVRLAEGRRPEQELPRLRRLCQEAMGHRSPKALIPVQEIPRGAGGKPLRRELARRHALR